MSVEKTMTLDVLSSIKGASSSKVIENIFQSIKNVNVEGLQKSNYNQTKTAFTKELREDVVVLSSELEKEIIRKGFPKQKNGYLVVQKIID